MHMLFVCRVAVQHSLACSNSPFLLVLAATPPDRYTSVQARCNTSHTALSRTPNIGRAVNEHSVPLTPASSHMPASTDMHCSSGTLEKITCSWKEGACACAKKVRSDYPCLVCASGFTSHSIFPTRGMSEALANGEREGWITKALTARFYHGLIQPRENCMCSKCRFHKLR
jgi:hypothetical protein